MEKQDFSDLGTLSFVGRESDSHGESADAANSHVRSRFSAALRQSKDEIDLAENLRTIWRRKMVFIATVVVFMTIAVLVILQLTPKYMAKALVMVGDRETKVVDVQAVLSDLSSDERTMQSELEVIRSRSLARRVIEQLGLVKDLEFNQDLRKEGILRTIFKLENVLPDGWLEALKGNEKELPLSFVEARDQNEARVIDSFLEQLGARVVNDSRVIQVIFESEESRKAAKIVNAIVDQYLKDQLDAKFEAAQRATIWLNEKISDLRAKLEQSETAVETYRTENNLVKGQQADTTVESLSQINSELMLAKSQTAEAVARLQQTKMLAESGYGLDSAAEVLESPLIGELRKQEAEVARKASELASEFGERHPKMINVQAEFARIRSDIEREVRKIIQGLSNEVTVARTREQSLMDSVKELENRAMAENQLQIRLRELQRDAEANRTLYQSLVARFKETSEWEEIQRADARVISRADVPDRPSFPDKTRYGLAAGIASIFFGLVLVFLLERLDHGVRNPEEIERLTGISALGIVPHAPTLTRRGQMGGFVLDKPSSAIAEAVRSLRTMLWLSDLDHPPKSICVTSSLTGEGKTMVAVWLARQAASAGEKVLLIDCDFRCPTVHTMLQIGDNAGLIGLLTGKHSLEDVITVDKASGAHIITTKKVNSTHLSLIGSDKFKRMIGVFRKHYDLVVIDSPPLLVVSDAKRLSRVVDKTIYLAKCESTPRETILAGLKQLVDIGGNVAGVVLTQVNMRKYGGHGYGAAGYYYGRHKKYYSG